MKTKKNILSQSEIEKYLSDNSVILSYPVPKGIRNDLHIINHNQASEECFDKIGKIIKNIYPDYYEDYEYVRSIDYMSCFNMLIAKRDIFDNYCKWLFDIMFEFEQYGIDYNRQNNKTGTERRVVGYIAELILNVYFMHNNYKIKFKPVTMFYTQKDKLYPIKKNGLFKSNIYTYI